MKINHLIYFNRCNVCSLS